MESEWFAVIADHVAVLRAKLLDATACARFSSGRIFQVCKARSCDDEGQKWLELTRFELLRAVGDLSGTGFVPLKDTQIRGPLSDRELAQAGEKIDILQAWKEAKNSPSMQAIQIPGIWEVVGGAEKGGILVRRGQDLGTAQESERLSLGALVEEVKLVGQRLKYARLTGTGPDTGWASIKLKEKNLIVKITGEFDVDDESRATSNICPNPSTPELEVSSLPRVVRLEGEQQPWRPCKLFTKVCVFGPHHSCTNALVRELARFFKVDAVQNDEHQQEDPLWKHRAFANPPAVSKDTLCICLVKDPGFWVQSLARDPAGGTFYDILPMTRGASKPARDFEELGIVCILDVFGRMMVARETGQVWMEQQEPKNGTERFVMIENSNGTIGFRASSGKYLTADRYGCISACMSSPVQVTQFAIVEHLDATLSLVTAFDAFVTVENTGRVAMSHGFNLLRFSEKFIIEEIDFVYRPQIPENCQTPESVDQLFGPVLFDQRRHRDALDVWEATVRAYLDEQIFPVGRTAVIRCEDFLFHFHEILLSLALRGLPLRGNWDAPMQPDSSPVKGGGHPHVVRRGRKQALAFYADPKNRFTGLSDDQVQRIRSVDPKVAGPLGYGEDLQELCA
eukprot:TRINITY_DN19600_c0_g2_i1.p1 TRINITY_DN19600_c0_g2~~TRINITY_DN19600_c0_g2_i1.p1  ORF type:complete len:648 (-),score=84.95 TRINITY_DN19600_c0_g2_i1:88-1956(-)